MEVIFSVVFILSLWTSEICGLECYHCSNITAISQCQTTTTCSQGERCYTRQHGVGSGLTFELGCAPENECRQALGPSIVGRAVKRQASCFQCCTVDRCNVHICEAGINVINEVGQCADDPTFDCARLSSSLNLCGDIHHAKSICRKFCKLCDLVDGSWSLWSGWTNCDVTCGSGHVTRTRVCTSPAPSHGGLNCVGNKTETQSCTESVCPVDGQWALWGPWGSSSETCGLGLHKRQRNCSSPKPSFAGDFCPGTPVDYKPCLLRGCKDGQWSSWTAWSNCTTSASGLKSRTRECNNPAPSKYGKSCTGLGMDFGQCPRQMVAFSVTGPNRTLVNGHPTFTRVITNIGRNFNTATGIFTCRIPGLYFFAATLLVFSQSTDVFCWICKNSNNILYVDGSNPESGDIDSGSGTVQIYLLLQSGDMVDICRCSNWGHIDIGRGTSFHGALMVPSN